MEGCIYLRYRPLLKVEIQYMQTHVTYKNTVSEYCQASVNLDKVLYLEYGNVYRKQQLCFF